MSWRQSSDVPLASLRHGIVLPEERAKLDELALGVPIEGGNMAPDVQTGGVSLLPGPAQLDGMVAMNKTERESRW